MFVRTVWAFKQCDMNLILFEKCENGVLSFKPLSTLFLFCFGFADDAFHMGMKPICNVNWGIRHLGVVVGGRLRGPELKIILQSILSGVLTGCLWKTPCGHGFKAKMNIKYPARCACTVWGLLLPWCFLDLPGSWALVAHFYFVRWHSHLSSRKGGLFQSERAVRTQCLVPAVWECVKRSRPGSWRGGV